MLDLVQIHRDITSEVKILIEPLKVVFPAQYGKLYLEAAQAQSIELKADELFDGEMLDDKIIRHIVTLHECADEALEAMDQEDKTLLRLAIKKTQQLQEEIHELHKIIYEDTLTKSYNRKWFQDKVLDENRLSIRDSGTLVMIDLNKFKMINDTYGHIIGDQVLFKVAQKLKETEGRVVRYGGDEFIIIFDKAIVIQDVKNRLESILEYFKKVHFQVKEHSFKINFAYGMASFSQDTQIYEVIEAADKVMYQHKKMNT